MAKSVTVHAPTEYGDRESFRTGATITTACGKSSDSLSWEAEAVTCSAAACADWASRTRSAASVVTGRSSDGFRQSDGL